MQREASTIIAVATPPGRSAIAIIRISGPDCQHCLQQLTKHALPQPRMATRRWIYDVDNHRLDDAIMLYFEKPKSYTGEDCAELHLHGSSAVLNATLQTCLKMDGIRLAEPGEFSRRALYAGKLDLHQVEATADLIDAETSAQVALAIAQMDGRSHQQLADWRAQAHDLAVNVEAILEFGEEEGDVDQSLITKVQAVLEHIEQSINQTLAPAQPHRLIRDGISVVLTGPVNAGKSTLFNRLVGSDMAIVHHSPGTTRDILEARLDIDGFLVKLKDTAGIRTTDNSVEVIGVDRAREASASADIRLLCMNALELDRHDISALPLSSPTDIRVLTKSDLVSRETSQMRGFDVLCSAQNGDGMDALLSLLKAKTRNIAEFRTNEDAIVINERQQHALSDILASLTACGAAVSSGDLALLAEELRVIDRAFARVLGMGDPEQLLDDIFSKFCIGK